MRRLLFSVIILICLNMKSAEQIVVNPVFDRTDWINFRIDKIKIKDDTTYIYCSFFAEKEIEAYISDSMYIEEQYSGKKHSILKAENIPFPPSKIYLSDSSYLHFTLYFPSIPSGKFNLIEDRDGKAFNIYGIDINRTYKNAYDDESINDYRELAEISEECSNWEDAIRSSLMQLEATNYVYGEQSIYASYAMFNLLYEYTSAQKYEEAVIWGEKAIEILNEQAKDSMSLDALSRTYGTISSAYYHLKEYDKSKQYQEKSLDLKKMGYGVGFIDYDGYQSLMMNEYNTHYSDSLFSVGVQLYNKQDYHKAINVFEKCDRYDRLFLDGEDNRLTYCTKWIGCCYYHLGDKERAIKYNPLYYEYPPIDRGLTTKADSLFNFSQKLFKLGRRTEGISIINDMIEEEIKSLGYQNYWVARAIESCGYLYELIDSIGTALECYKKAYSIRNNVLKKTHGDVGMSLVDIASCYQKLGIDTLKAIEYYVDGFNIIANSGYPFYPYCASRMQNLSKLFEEIHDYGLAISYSLQTISLYKKMASNEDETINGYIFERYNSIMRMCYETKRYGDAEKYGSKALKLAKILFGESNPHYSNLLSLFSSIYAEAGKLDKAIETDSLLLANFKVVEWDLKQGNEEFYQYQMYLGFLDKYIEHLKKNGDYDKAISQFDLFFETLEKCDILFKDPQFIVFKYNLLLADCYAGKGLYSKAIEIVNSILQKIGIPNDKKYESFKEDCIFELMGYYAVENDFEHLDELVAKTEIYTRNKDLSNKQNRLDFLFWLYENIYANTDRNHIALISIMSEAKRISVVEKDTLTLLNCYSNLAFCYYDIGKKQDALIQIKNALRVVEGSEYQEQEIYADFLHQAGSYYGLMNNCDSSVFYHQKAYEHGLKLKEYRFIDDLRCIGYDYKMQGNYNKAINFFRKSIEEKKKYKYTEMLSSTYVDLLTVYIANNDWNKQIETAKEYFTIYSDVSEENYLRMLKAICKGLFSNGNYDDAIKFGQISVNCHKKIHGDSSPELKTPLYDLSLAYFRAGDYVRGIEYGQDAIRIMKSNTNRFSDDYANDLEGMATFYSEIGEIDKCLEMRNQALDIISELYGEESPEAAMILHNLSVDFSRKGNKTKALELAKRVVEIRKHSLGKNHYLYARSLGNLGVLLSGEGKYKEALEKLEEALSIEQKCYGDTSMLVAERYIHIGNVYRDTNDSSHVEECYQKAYSILRKQEGIIGNLRSDIVFVKQALVNYFRDSEQYSECSYLLCKEVNEISKKVSEDIIKIQDNYRSVIWDANNNAILYQLPTLAYATKADSLIEKMYDYSALFGKGLMLNSYNTISQIVMNADSITREQFKKLFEIKALKEIELSKAAENRIEEIEDLDAKIKQLENSLFLGSVDYAAYKKNIDFTWRDVLSKLGDKDLAIEFYSVSQSDSVIYLALTIKKGYQHPKLIRLFDIKEMPKWKWGTENTNIFYKLIWEPLESEFDGVNNIYFSPWYSLNSIPLENLPNSQGRYMSDMYNMYRLSSTRQLITSQPYRTCTNVAIYGGLNYDDVANETLKETSSYISAYRGVLDSADARGGVDYLPYSLEEAKSIAKEARKYGINNSVYMGIDGTEESFKKLSNSSIDLIHLATHGFYYNADAANNAARNLNYTFLFKNGSREEQALNRSFLIMSGGNRLTHRDSIPEGKDDGILTAKEVSIMNLQNVNVLVLSACQSGLGDFSSEGVMGLQQGFKKAGVNTIIMALDNIDDEATQLFMEYFYKNLFSGKSKRESMTNAQKQLRAYKHGKYDKPEYWASFIMLDGIK